MTKVLINAEQLINLRNNVIILEALNEESAPPQADSGVEQDYNELAIPDMNREPDKTPPDKSEKSEAEVFGEITKGLYNYARQYDLANKISLEIANADPTILASSAKQFIEKLLYGVYRMSSDPTQNEAFERFLRSIGITTNKPLLTTQNT